MNSENVKSRTKFNVVEPAFARSLNEILNSGDRSIRKLWGGWNHMIRAVHCGDCRTIDQKMLWMTLVPRAIKTAMKFLI